MTNLNYLSTEFNILSQFQSKMSKRGYKTMKKMSKRVAELINCLEDYKMCAVTDCENKENLHMIYCDDCQSQIVCKVHTSCISITRKCPVCKERNTLQRKWSIPYI